MPQWLVELRGEAREVFSVEADTAEQAAEHWPDGDSQVLEASGMEVVSVREDD